jgi:hypothetical protein
MNILTIEYPPEVLDALNQDSREFEAADHRVGGAFGWDATEGE